MREVRKGSMLSSGEVPRSEECTASSAPSSGGVRQNNTIQTLYMCFCICLHNLLTATLYATEFFCTALWFLPKSHSQSSSHTSVITLGSKPGCMIHCVLGQLKLPNVNNLLNSWIRNAYLQVLLLIWVCVNKHPKACEIIFIAKHRACNETRVTSISVLLLSITVKISLLNI